MLDASQDDIGARANFGRGNPTPNNPSAYDQFLQKFANFQVNRHTKNVLESCLILGSVDIKDLLNKCEGKNPYKDKDRQILINAVNEHYQRSKAIVKSVFESGARLFYMNGDHNNMAQIVGGFYEAKKVKPVVVYLDFHSDARPMQDGPHSGTWMSEIFARN